MILLSRLNQSELYINATMIEMVEETPDTVLTLVNGKKIVVKETVTEVLTKIDNYYRLIGLVGSYSLQGMEE